MVYFRVIFSKPFRNSLWCMYRSPLAYPWLSKIFWLSSDHDDSDFPILPFEDGSGANLGFSAHSQSPAFRMRCSIRCLL